MQTTIDVRETNLLYYIQLVSRCVWEIVFYVIIVFKNEM